MQTPSFAQIEQRINMSRNYRLIGEGCYARVYLHEPTGRVVRFNQAWCYDAFVDLVKSCQDNPHFPAIFAHRQFPNGETITVLERLEAVHYAGACTARENKIIETAFSLARATFWKEQTNAWLDRYRLLNIYGAPESLLDAAWAVGVVVDENQFNLDLHMGNIMRRPTTGELVFTDPYA